MSFQSGDFDPRQVLRVLWKHKWSTVLCAVLLAGAALGWSLTQPDKYHGQATILLQGSDQSAFGSSQNVLQGDQQARELATQVNILESRTIFLTVHKTLPKAPRVTGITGSTNVIAAQTVSKDPKLAAESANAYAEAYINLRREQSVADLVAASSSIDSEVQSLQSQLDQLDQQIASASPTSPNLSALKAQRSNILDQQTAFKFRVDQLNVDATLKNGGAVLVDAAVIPKLPFEPRTKRNIALGGVVGLALGLALSLLRDRLDDRVRSREDVESATGGLPVLGLVPRTPQLQGAHSVITRSAPASAVAEAYRSLRTSIQFLGAENDLQTLMVTSALPGEGKTTTAANLALAMGRSGQRVVVLDADLRKPRLHEVYGVDGTVGVAQILAGTARIEDAIQLVDHEPNLMVLPAGPVPANPSELLGSRRMLQLIDALCAECNLLILDTPPILPVTDAVALSNAVDACLLVTSRSTKRQLARTIELLRQVNAPISGIVLNGATAEDDPEYGYGYGYGGTYGGVYGEESGASERRAKRKSGKGRKAGQGR